MPSGVSALAIADWLNQNFPQKVKISSGMLFGEFASYLFFTNSHLKRELHSKPKTFIFDMIKRLSRYKICHITEKLILNEALEAFPSRANTRKKYRNDFRTLFFSPALKMGLAKLDPRKQEWVNIQCKLIFEENSTNKRVGTIGVDICTFLKNNTSQYMHSPQSHNYIKDVFEPIWDKDWKNLDKDEISKIQEYLKNAGYKKYISKFIDCALKKGTLLENIGATEESYSISMKKDIWVFRERKGTRSKLDFSNTNKEIKLALKLWMQWRIMGGYSANSRAKKVIENTFIPFLEKEGITLKQFTNPKKKKLLVWFRTHLIKNSTELVLTLSYEHIVQFIRFLQNNHPKTVNGNVVFMTKEVPFKETKKKKGGYTDKEIEILSQALTNDKDKLIVNILLLLMLTAKRFGEILKLDDDCIVNIDKFIYLKYTNFKTSTEDLLPLQSKDTSKTDNPLDHNISKSVLRCIKELRKISLPHKTLCDTEDAKKLITVEHKARNNRGYKSGMPSDSFFYKRIAEFKARNAIDFPIEVHRFRHTLATKIIRDGHGHDVAARILGNKSHTVEMYYESDISKADTLRLKASPVIHAETDARELMNFDNTPKYIKDGDKDYTTAVPGGRCKEGLYAAQNCKYYNRLFGSGGCLGCSQLGVSKENLSFYSDLFDDISAELKQMVATPFEIPILSKLTLVGNTLSKIKQKGEENA